MARDITSDDALVTEVERMVVRREIGLVSALRRAERDAPDSSLCAALAELLSAREARLARFRAASGGSAAQVDQGDPVTAASWADEATVGAALGRAFLQELRARLGRPVALLDDALDSEPAAPDALRQAAGDRGAMAATTKRVVHEMTNALLASPMVSAHLGREGSLAAFAALFDALPEDALPE